MHYEKCVMLLCFVLCALDRSFFIIFHSKFQTLLLDLLYDSILIQVLIALHFNFLLEVTLNPRRAHT